MQDRKIDSRIITPEWLKNKILFRPYFCQGQFSMYETAKQKYTAFKKQINQNRAKSGQPPLTDYDIREIIDNAEGVFNIKPIFKPGE